MDDVAFVVFGALAFVIVALATIRLVFFFRDFNDRTRYIRREIARASSADELKYWKHELKKHRLSLLPGFKEPPRN